MLAQALEEVFNNEYHNFKHYILSRFDNIDEYDAEDIIQQTVLHLLSKQQNCLTIKNITAYMYTSLRNGTIDHLKKNRHRLIDIDTLEIVDKHSAEVRILADELKGVIKAAIDTLDKVSKYIFIETEIKRRSYKSLSAETGMNLNTLLSRKSRAVHKLRSKLRDYINHGSITNIHS